MLGPKHVVIQRDIITSIKKLLVAIAERFLRVHYARGCTPQR
jgi:hypothetical protein